MNRKAELREALLNDFAIRSFRDTGDRDYVHARLAYRARLVPQFLWSALHCLEKYTKCILVLNRVPARSFKHEVTGALNLLAEQGPFSVPLCKQSKQFVARLETMAQYRYFEVSYWNLEHDILRLDRVVWELRRYCQVLSYEIPSEGAKKNALQLNLARLQDALERETKNSCVPSGLLEKIIADKTNPAREPLLWNNLHFGPSRRRKIRLVPFFEAGNAPLYMHPEILDDVLKYVHLPKSVVSAWREEMRKKGAELQA